MSDQHRDSSMEVDLLHDMINERDKKIVRLVEITEAKEAKIARIKVELSACRINVAESRISNQEEMDLLLTRRSTASQGRVQLEHSVRQQNGSLHNYAEILKEAAPDAVDSSYVVRMQAQLCKAMHSMGILEHQLEIIKTYCADVIKFTKDSLSEMIEQRTQMEVSIMNELMIIDKKTREIEDEFKSKIDKKRREIHLLQESISGFDIDDTDNEGEDSDKSDEDENDDDIEIDDDLLKEIIDERHDEIAKQESENSLQLNRIQQLERQIKALQVTNSETP